MAPAGFRQAKDQDSSVTSVFRRPNTNIRLGEICLQAGMLTQDQLQEAIRHSKGKRLQIGQILVMCGFLTPRDLQSVLTAQSMIRDKSIDFALAIRCLKIAFKMGSSFSEVLDNHEEAPARKAPTGRLGELLLEAGVLKWDQLSKAMEQSLQTGLPLGRMLVLHQVLTDAVLNSVLDIQVRLRDEMLSREEAVNAVRRATGLPSSSSDTSTVEKPQPEGPRRRGIRLGEMLVLSGVLTETDVMNALEWGLVNQQSIGNVLINRSLITSELLEAALKLQKLVDESQLDALNAAECLGQIHESKISLEEAMENSKGERPDIKPSLSYEKLLTLARVVNQEDIQAAFDLSSKSPQIVGKVLVLTGYSDAPTVQATLRCYQLLAKGWISQDDAVAALDYCLHHRQNKKINFDQAVKELGWSPNKRLRMDGEAAAIPELVSENPSLPTVEDELESAIPVNKPQELTVDIEKRRKFSETILPEDAKAMQLANLVKQATGQKTEEADADADEEAADQKTALANAFVRLAQSYCDQGNYVEAQQVFERILVNRLNELGPNNVELTTDLTNLAAVLCVQGKFNQAEPFMRRAVWVLENADVPAPLRLADAYSMLGEIYFRQDKFAEAESPVTKALSLRQSNLPADHTDIADALSSQAKLMRKTGRAEEAEKIYAKAQQILSKKQDQAAVTG
ncbi:MAG TPA: tetratricopeptide repeat protein [Candidatus Melainabacteria bacterium]|nr:tetratricopeptide repeat protein [Candidatus Melainabacteria bacterium]